jgi:hypothetical protein
MRWKMSSTRCAACARPCSTHLKGLRARLDDPLRLPVVIAIIAVLISLLCRPSRRSVGLPCA